MPFLFRLSVLLALLTLAGTRSADAAGIYRCTDAAGVVVFSETPCGRDARKLEIRGQPSTPAEPQNPARSVASPPEAASAAVRPTAVDSAASSADSPADPARVAPGDGKDWAAFKCSTDKGMVFYRFGHCPRTIDVTRRRSEGDVQTVFLDTLAVEERGTNVPTACQAIHGRSAAGRWGREFDDSSVVSDAGNGSRDLCEETSR